MRVKIIQPQRGCGRGLIAPAHGRNAFGVVVSLGQDPVPWRWLKAVGTFYIRQFKFYATLAQVPYLGVL